MLMESEYAEDKFAGALIYQDILIPNGGVTWREDLPTFAGFFDDGHIWDWSTCDWFCVRVLGRLVESQEDLAEREACARQIAKWSEAENLWRMRASCVAFVNCARQGDAFFPGFRDMVLDICRLTVRRQERFGQTGTGWVLREVGKGNKRALLTFCNQNLRWFSREGLRYALEKVPKTERDRIVEQHKKCSSVESGGPSGEDATKPQGRKRRLQGD